MPHQIVDAEIGQVPAAGSRPPLGWLLRGARSALGAIALVTVFAGSAAAQGVIGETTVFAHVPAPGHPFGVAVDSNRIFVDTSDGDFFAPHLNSNGERVFSYSSDGHLLSTTRVATQPNASMGLNGLALDGNQGRDHYAYIADMNGRVLRLAVNRPRAKPTVFSEVPPPMTYGNWGVSMWNDLVFDPAGNLYMTDDKPRLWRIAPNGTPSVWFQDPAIEGLFGFAGGPLGGRIDPSGKYLYFAVTVSEAFSGESVVYRLPLIDHPTATDLQVVHTFPVAPGEVLGSTSPDATGIAFAKSGDLYVSLTGENQIAVLDPAGNEIRRISSPLFDSPWGLAFIGKSLLVTNAEIRPQEDPNRWTVLKVFVGEEGLPLNRPASGPQPARHGGARSLSARPKGSRTTGLTSAL